MTQEGIFFCGGGFDGYQRSAPSHHRLEIEGPLSDARRRGHRVERKA